MTIFLNITMSLDGFVAGPNQTLEEPLGEGGEQLHEWSSGSRAGVRNTGSRAESRTRTQISSARRTSGLARTSWAGACSAAARARGRTTRRERLVGRRPAVRRPVYVVTHHAREPLVLGSTTFTFVNGIEEAIRQAREAAGDRDVQISGGASVAQQALNAGLLDELHIHVAPQVLGGGVRLFESADQAALELVRAVESPHVAHLTYRVR